jgi:hypothetical protein
VELKTRATDHIYSEFVIGLRQILYAFYLPSSVITSPSFMKYFILSVLLVAANVSFAQFFKITRINNTDSTKVFFEIEPTQRAAAVKRMNGIIAKDWGYNPNASDRFENLVVDEATDFSYVVSANNERVLSMTVESSYSACGLHITRFVYNFDARTGEPLGPDKIFGADGQLKLRKALHKSWKSALKSAAADKDDYHVDEYKACLAEAEKTTEKGVARMLLTDTGIKFWVETCVEGTTYDFEADKSQGPFEYSFGKLLPMLTSYGYALFANKSAAPVQTLMRGTIDGKYPISLTLLDTGSAGTIGGMIVYDRVGEPINLGGTMNGNQIVFHELDDSRNALSDIEVTWDGTKLGGSFTNLKSKKQMPFVATVVK